MQAVFLKLVKQQLLNSPIIAKCWLLAALEFQFFSSLRALFWKFPHYSGEYNIPQNKAKSRSFEFRNFVSFPEYSFNMDD